MPKKQSVKAADGYDLIVSMNGEVFSVSTSDLKKELHKFTPEQVHTEVYINVKKGQADFIRRFSIQDAKKLFRDDDRKDVFITNILF